MSYLKGIYGVQNNGLQRQFSVSPSGHIKAEIHNPLTPFGAVNAEKLTPIFQTDAVYGLNAGQVSYGSNASGSVTTSDSMFVCSTGASVGGAGYLQSRKRLRYRPGQGVVGRFSAMFTNPVEDSFQVAGFGHSEDGIFFGFKGADFGIIYTSFGVREIQTLTVTNAVTSAGNITVVLNDVAYSIAISVNAVGSIARTVYEIANGVYSGWRAQANGAGTKVVFVANSAGDATGAFSVTSLGIEGNFVQTKQGQAVSEIFVPRSSWTDSLDGSADENNPSGFELDPLKMNVFQFKIQDLGAGVITCQVECTHPNDNCADLLTIYTFKFPSSRIKPSFSNAAFPFTASAYSLGSTTNLSVYIGSFAGFIVGDKKLHGNRLSYYNSTTLANSSDLRCLFTIENSLVHKGKANQSVINVLSINAAVKHTQPVGIYLIKNVALNGAPSFEEYATDESVSLYDIAATTCSALTSNTQIVWSGHLGETGNLNKEFDDGGLEEITIQPGESITVATRAVQNNPAWVVASINTREDQ